MVDETGKKEEAEATTVMARYNILNNVFVHLEYRNLSDDDNITTGPGGNVDEDKFRLFLVGLF
jgi:hypothetical protein